jgi:hypothetical protein
MRFIHDGIQRLFDADKFPSSRIFFQMVGIMSDRVINAPKKKAETEVTIPILCWA